ncbi:sugar transferase [Streptomyces sp. NPDC056411]|uniref:sugar transferase n=1 Tax=Streptomyces sp. NPDC056411 TaxID=3345813 RepID=UPI0035DE963F
MTTERAEAPHTDPAPSPALPRPPAAAVVPPRGPAWETLPPPRPRRCARPATVAALTAGDGLATAGTALVVLGPGTPPVLLAAMAAVVVLLHARAGLYRPGPAPAALGDLPALLGRAAVCWCATAAVLAAEYPGRAPALVPLAGAVAAHTVLACYGRATVYRARRNLARRRPRSTLIVGTDPAAGQLAAALLARPGYGLWPVGVVPSVPLLPAPAGLPADRPAPSLPRLSCPQDITRAVIRHTVRDAVFTVPPYADPHTAALLRRFVDQGSVVWLAGAAAAGEGGRPHPEPDHLWGFACRRLETGPPRHGGRAKRAVDLVLATIGLVAALPVLLGCALAVRLADGPGVLFRQERIGRDGRRFTLLKFRTLRPVDAHEAATRWTVADDPRIGRVGRLLRRTSLDELPQLWNVLRGEMSLVGPRPERPFFVEQFSRRYPDYAARHRMPAGMTGLAQVHGLRGDTSVADRVRFDNLYIDGWSLWQDVRIMLRTVVSLCRLEGR